MVKVFHDPDQLSRRLHDLGWNGSIQRSGQFFYYGCGGRRPKPAGEQMRASRRANLSRQSVMIIASRLWPSPARERSSVTGNERSNAQSSEPNIEAMSKYDSYNPDWVANFYDEDGDRD